MEQPETRNANSGEVTNLTQIGGSVYGDVTIFAGSRPAPRAAAARPYLLLETGEVVGRTTLRLDVEEFLAGGGASVLLLIGVPGIGKSALAWDAWKRLRETGRRQFWYSFYDGRGVGSFAGMLPELGRFLGLPASAHVGDVLDAVAEQEVLLFLDGIERCLRCYQRPLAAGDLDAIRIQEGGADLWRDVELGFASDDALRFFQQLTELPAGRVVATSRVVPADYFASGGALRAGVTSRVVGSLPPGESSALLAAVGTSLEPADAATVASVLGGHPLALQLLARQVRRSLRPPSSLSKWLVEEGYLAVEGAGPQQIRDRLFARAAAALSTPACVLLAATGVLGGAADLPSLRELDPSALTDDEFHHAVAEIVASGLGITSEGELACHALTAAAATSRLEPAQTAELVRTLSAALRGRFKEIDTGAYFDGYFRWFTAGGGTDRAEAMALCRALVRLGEWQEAARLYLHQLDAPVRFVLGANFEAVELLQGLVAGLASEQGPILPDDLRASLAHHLLMIGRIDQAAEALDAMSSGGEDHDTLMARARVAFHRGDIAKALEHGLKAVHLARRRLSAVTSEDNIFDDFNIFAFERATMLMGPPAGDQIEALSLCAELLALAGRTPEAARLLVEGLWNWRWTHEQCDGCRGLLIRTAAVVFAVDGDGTAASVAGAKGRELQASQGKTLQGLFADVIVAVRSHEAEPQLHAALGEAGFVLYQLMIQERGLPLRPLSARMVSRSVGWLGGSPASQPDPEHEELLAGLVARAWQATAEETLESHLATALKCHRAGDAAGYDEAIDRAFEIDPCDSRVRGTLAARAARAGDADTALEHLGWLFDVNAAEGSYQLAADLVTGPGRLADGVRALLVNERAGLSVVNALVAVERKSGDEAAARRWLDVAAKIERRAFDPF